MTPKEKAEQLLKTFALGRWPKANSLKAVDNLIDEHTFKNPIKWNIERKKFWQEVKKELEKI